MIPVAPIIMTVMAVVVLAATIMPIVMATLTVVGIVPRRLAITVVLHNIGMARIRAGRVQYDIHATDRVAGIRPWQVSAGAPVSAILPVPIAVARRVIDLMARVINVRVFTRDRVPVTRPPVIRVCAGRHRQQGRESQSRGR